MGISETILKAWSVRHNGICPNCGSRDCCRVEEDDGWDYGAEGIEHWLSWTFECDCCKGLWSLEWRLGDADAYWHEGSAEC